VLWSLVGWRRIVVVEQGGWATSVLRAPLASLGLSFFTLRRQSDVRFCSRFSFRRFGTRVFFAVDFFFWKKRFQWCANLYSSVSGLEVRQVGMWAS
jgi:hypothetical protein